MGYILSDLGVLPQQFPMGYHLDRLNLMGDGNQMQFIHTLRVQPKIGRLYRGTLGYSVVKILLVFRIHYGSCQVLLYGLGTCM